jgi:osmoprotectant transport system permease protein
VAETRVKTIRGAFDYLTDPSNWTGPNGIIALGWAQIWISIVALTISAALAVPAAVWLAHGHRAPNLSVAMVNLTRAIPSFAIVALAFPLSIRFGFGLGFWPTCVALIALGVPPLFTNAYEGVAGTSAELVEAANGIGMTDRQVLRRVELPVAVPLLMTGIRVSAVQIIATATLGAIVGYQCLGTYIVSGLRRGGAGRVDVLVGAILVAALALVADVMIERLQRWLTPWRQVERQHQEP